MVSRQQPGEAGDTFLQYMVGRRGLANKSCPSESVLGKASST